ncbi:MAG: ADP-ribosylglycohydrolase family protein [Candidatus Pristimantibacillus sp.]
MLIDRVISCVFGATIGDALGVPVEFNDRERLDKMPVEDMRSYGTYDQPKGTWSDDSSLTFGLMESLIAGYDLNDIADKMVKYLDEGYWTPHGELFDIGNITRDAILKYKKGTSPVFCGGEGVYDNGNGALMRIMPIVFYLGKDTDYDAKKTMTEEISSITHRHPRALLGSLIYVEFLQNLFANMGKEEAYIEMIKVVKEHLNVYPYNHELKNYEAILSGNLPSLTRDQIKSSGYVIDSLEASMWSFMTSESYSKAVLKAINLGADTDTNGFLTGSFAGLYYSMDHIPDKWIEDICKKEEIVDLCERFVSSIEGEQR